MTRQRVMAATRLKLGPLDHGRRVSYEKFLASECEEGYGYELIDGKVYVSPRPDLPHARLDKWVYDCIDRYASLRPEVLNDVYGKAIVCVPGRPGVTRAGPDLVAYQDFPHQRPFADLRWED